MLCLHSIRTSAASRYHRSTANYKISWSNKKLYLFGNSTRFKMSSAVTAPRRKVGKKFVIGCDGTWMNSDAGFQKDVGSSAATIQLPSNVTRMIRALDHFHEIDGVKIPQICYYSKGVGTGNLEDKLLGGLEGDDITEHIREAYAFVANNFFPISQLEVDDPKVAMDEIVVLGFSRGAYTARAIADLISGIGLLTRYGMEKFFYIFTDWQNQATEKEAAWFKEAYPSVAKDFQAKNGRAIKFTDKEYRLALITDKSTRWGMNVRAVCCWDTVGSLGIPFSFSWSKGNVKPLSFVNQQVATRVEHAFHSLALDEHRGAFSPTLWEQPEPDKNTLKVLKQTWFPGAHSNIGGGYPDMLQSNISLAWMISQLEDHDGGILSFNDSYLDWMQDQAIHFYKTRPAPIRAWGLGKINDSSAITTKTSIIESFHPLTRTPGRYHKVSTATGTQGTIPLKGTNEAIHHCVRVRIEKKGPGPETLVPTSKLGSALNLGKAIFAGIEETDLKELPSYIPPALEKTYKLLNDAAQAGGAPSDGHVVWKAVDKGLDLPEDVLGRTEQRMMQRWISLVH